MAYNPYYPNGWKNNEEGETPITAAALQNMEDGIVDLDEAVSDLNSKFIIQNKNKSYSISANGTFYFNLYEHANNVEGYKPVGVVGFSTNSDAVTVINASVANQTYGVFLQNRTNTAVNQTLVAYVLYQKI